MVDDKTNDKILDLDKETKELANRISNNNTRLIKLENDVSNINQLNRKIVEYEHKQENIKNDIKQLCDMTKNLEALVHNHIYQKPLEEKERIQNLILTTIVGAFLGFALAQFGF